MIKTHQGLAIWVYKGTSIRTFLNLVETASLILSICSMVQKPQCMHIPTEALVDLVDKCHYYVLQREATAALRILRSEDVDEIHQQISPQYAVWQSRTYKIQGCHSSEGDLSPHGITTQMIKTNKHTVVYLRMAKWKCPTEDVVKSKDFSHRWHCLKNGNHNVQEQILQQNWCYLWICALYHI
jgi:hypothetical protein